MSFLWPPALWGLLLVPGLVVWYVWMLRRGAGRPVAYSTVALLSAAASHGRPVRRHAAAAAFLLGIAVIILALARPVTPIPVPADRSAIMLAIDSSGSMRSEDIEPTRLDAAKRAARTFVQTLPRRVRVGLVSFAGFATLRVPPTTDRQMVLDAIDGLYYARRTAIGEGLLEAMAALPGRVRPLPDGTLPAIPPGKKSPGIIILLSDGRSNTGIDSVRAAEIARLQEVTVYTIGVGAPEARPGAYVIGGSMDEEELQVVARAAGGQYFRASSADALRDVYKNLARAVGWERRAEEITAAFALLGALALIVSVTASRLLTYPLRL